MNAGGSNAHGQLGSGVSGQWIITKFKGDNYLIWRVDLSQPLVSRLEEPTEPDDKT